MNKRDIEKLNYTGTEIVKNIGGGLYIRIREHSKTFLVKSKMGGKARVKTIGKFPDLPLSKAIKIAAAMKGEVTVKHTFGDYVETYYQECILGNHNRKKAPHKRPEQALRYLNQIKEKFGNLLIDNITKQQLTTYIRDYSKRGARTGEVMRVHLASVFADAFERGLINVNPMMGITSKTSGYKQVNRERILTDAEICDLWDWQNNDKGWQNTEENKKVIQFLLLTGLRISEAQAGYVDGDKFRIDDSKNGKSHWVYLTETAKRLLPLPDCTTTNIQAWLKRKLISCGYKDKIERYTAHDCRRTFATKLNDTGVAVHVVEKCLNHSLPGLMAVYNKAEYEQERIDAAITMEQLVLDTLIAGL